MTAPHPTAAVGRDGQTLEGTSRLVALVNFVKLPHTVFALPFALVGVILASVEHPVTWRALVWVVVAFTSARFAAMGVNRIVDREIDGANPRTAMRELPRGVLSTRDAVIATTTMTVLFIVAAWRLNPLCLALSPVALAWTFGYSYTKRFTRWSHIVLGIGISIAPVGGYLAITGAWSTPAWMLVLLSSAVAAWVAGFDILYALQDVSFDTVRGLHSIPKDLGEGPAFMIARALHAWTVVALTLVGVTTGRGARWMAGVALTAVLLMYEHRLVRPGDLRRLDAAFFTMNGIISLAFFGCALLDRVLGA
ncbi:MAG: putative 4-hydroxybenzoate polyprenyltransferase [Gemmatimonadaceae bacterium]|nr:putative 4-hydroxybenzoate polyprenyltransferase [Gemmatimonadaceae bacterium]